MARIKGLANFSANFEPQIASPLDARAIVQYQSDLLLESTWQANDGIVYTYKGMLVSVVDDVTVENNGLYILSNSDYTQLSNWTKVSGGAVSGGTYIYDWVSGTSYSQYTPLVDNSLLYRVIITGYTSSQYIDDDVSDGYVEALGGAIAFTGLTDTPSYYSDGKFLAVSGDSIVYVDAPSASGDTYTNLIPTEIAVGGVPIGTTFSGLTPSQVFDMLFYPELFPTLVNPSSTFVLTQAGLQEIGLLIATLNFSSTFSRGTITPAYGTSGFRSGLPNTYVYSGTDLSDFSSTLLSDSKTVTGYTVLSGAQNWTGRVRYDGGEQPLSNKGNNYDSPLSSGLTSVITRTITGVYPYFGTSVNITTRTKQTLALHNATYWQVNMVAESGSDKQTAWLPDAFIAITGIQFYNTVSSTWEWIGGSRANSLLTFTVTTTQIDVNGTLIDYDVYTHNGALIGARQLRFYTT